MKQQLSQAHDFVRSAVDRVKTWFDPPLDADARPLEIRERIVDDIERRAEPMGGGRRVLPYNHVVVTLLAPQRHDRLRMEATLVDIESSIRTRLREFQCALPAGFSVAIRYTKRAPAEWAANQRLAISYDARDSTLTDTNSAEEFPKLRIAITRGDATQSAYTFAEPHVRIGRGATPMDGRGQPRLNHIVFVENGDEHTQTVGRAHASIHYDRARREYRLFDDGSQNGTRIRRDATIVDIVRRDPVGVTLKSGDEIQIGTATMRVHIG